MKYNSRKLYENHSLTSSLFANTMAKPYKIIIPNSLYIYTYKKCNVKEEKKGNSKQQSKNNIYVVLSGIPFQAYNP